MYLHVSLFSCRSKLFKIVICNKFAKIIFLSLEPFDFRDITVTPHTGVWIETSRTKLGCIVKPVTPHTGVWIETTSIFIPPYNLKPSPPIRGCGLKPFHGSPPIRGCGSPPIRGCGLKPFALGVLNMSPRHPPYGGVD